MKLNDAFDSFYKNVYGTVKSYGMHADSFMSLSYSAVSDAINLIAQKLNVAFEEDQTLADRAAIVGDYGIEVGDVAFERVYKPPCSIDTDMVWRVLSLLCDYKRGDIQSDAIVLHLNEIYSVTLSIVAAYRDYCAEAHTGYTLDNSDYFN